MSMDVLSMGMSGDFEVTMRGRHDGEDQLCCSARGVVLAVRRSVIDRILALMGLDIGMDPEEMVDDIRAMETVEAQFGDKVVTRALRATQDS